jgi:hypothetical protein
MRVRIQINAAIHRVAVTRARCHAETIEFIARKKTERTPMVIAGRGPLGADHECGAEGRPPIVRPVPWL